MTLPDELHACDASLDELAQLLKSLPAGAYAARVEALGASIGGHTRHMLEHYLNLLELDQRGYVHFEDRRRDPRLESEVQTALGCVASLRAWLQSACGGQGLDRPVATKVSVFGKVDESVAVDSSFRRELIYAFLHGIHHQALIAVGCRLLGLSVPDGFGLAPATRVFRETA